MSIAASQIVFAHVEAEQSPARRRGYQTLFYSRDGLVAEEVRQVELRLFYVPKGDLPAKHVFFPLASGKLVVAQIVPLPGTDVFGRAGRYLAHALIFSAEDFTELDNSPFRVFRDFPFWTTVEQALAAGDFKTGGLPPAVFQPAPSHAALDGLAGLDAEQLRTLLLLAAQAARLHSEHRAVGLFGSAEAAFALIEGLFSLLPAPLRLQCSFDTLFVEGTLGRQPYWAVGLPTGLPRQAKLLPFDLKQSRFLQEVRCAPATEMETWLAGMALQQPLESAARAVESGEWRSLWPNGQRSGAGHPNSRSGSMEPTFDEALRSADGAQVLQSLRKQTGTVLGERLLPMAIRWIEQQGGAGRPPAEFPQAQLMRWVGRVFSDPGRRPSTDEVDDLERFVARSQHPNLKLVFYRWACQWDEMAAAVPQLDEDVFRDFADWALETLPLRVGWQVCQREDGVVFGPHLAAEGASTSEIAGLLSALLGIPPSDAARSPAPNTRSAPPARWSVLMDLVKDRGNRTTARR